MMKRYALRDWQRHGGRIDLARAAYPDAPMPWLDLSTGINPVPYPAAAGDALPWGPLPSPADLAALEAAARACFGGAEVPVAALPGSEIGLRLLARLDLPGPVSRVAPGYGTYAAAFPAARAIGCDDLAAAAAAGGTIVLGNPNNPDGRILDPRSLLDLARRPGPPRLFVIDEAFADATPAASVLPLLRADDPVIVFRSFGKFFGLAGLRLGFVLGAARFVAGLREMLGDWPVAAPAIAIGRAAYDDAAWIAATRAGLDERAAALDALLARHDLAPGGTCPLFRLVVSPRAAAIFARLARYGILARPFDHAPGWLRLGVPADDAERDRLDRALADG